MKPKAIFIASALTIVAVTLVATARNGRQSSGSTTKTNWPISLEERNALVVRTLAPIKITDQAALEKEFAEVQKRYPGLADYLSLQEAQVFFASVAATGSCIPPDRPFLTPVARTARKSICPDRAVTPMEVRDFELPCYQRLCWKELNACRRELSLCPQYYRCAQKCQQ
jgi:hypothetical protein